MKTYGGEYVGSKPASLDASFAHRERLEMRIDGMCYLSYTCSVKGQRQLIRASACSRETSGPNLSSWYHAGYFKEATI